MFALLAFSILVGLVLGLVTGGRFAAMKEVRFRASPVLFVSFLVLLIPLFFGLPSGLRITIQVLTMLGVLTWVALNMRESRGLLRAGLAIIALGWLLNFVVITINGSMPLSVDAYYTSGQTETPTPGRGGFFRIELEDENTRLRALGDVIPIKPVTQVLSIGDVLLVAGLMVAVAGSMRPQRVPSDA